MFCSDVSDGVGDQEGARREIHLPVKDTGAILYRRSNILQNSQWQNVMSTVVEDAYEPPSLESLGPSLALVLQQGRRRGMGSGSCRRSYVVTLDPQFHGFLSLSQQLRRVAGEFQQFSCTKVRC
jgi:hypothetical protein